MKRYLVNPSIRGCLGIIKAKSVQEAEIEAIKRFGLVHVFVKEV